VTIGIGLVRIGNQDWIKDWVRIGIVYFQQYKKKGEGQREEKMSH
jgi:hypothetical protein